MRKSGAEKILEDYKKNKSIPEKIERTLIGLLVDLLVEKSGGLYPNIVAKTSLAKGAIALFPVFKDEEGDIVSWQNRSRNKKSQKIAEYRT